ncbi:MAG: prolipoprotein diacylglyceryl transferase [Ruminococcus sp.]|nr:prolipoprotein diacylglyceryl transferase [Ruminococcus sp.]
MYAAVERITDPNQIQFPKLGIKLSIDPTAFTIGNLAIQWYGILITVGLVLALVYCFPKMKRFGLDSDRTIDAVIGGVFGGIVGARLYYVLLKWDDYKGKGFKEMINTRNGGLAIYGGIIGALLVGLIVCKLRKVKVLPMLDITVLGFLIGQGVGRWGNFVNQEAFGTNTNSFLGMTGGRIQSTIIAETQIGGDMYLNGNPTMFWETPVHPCFLYESLWCIIGFVLLAWFSKRRKYDGQLFLMYMAWYGAERFFVESLRTDSLMIGSIRASQALSAVIFIVSVILQIVMLSKLHRDPERYTLYCHTKESRLLLEESRRRRMGVSVEDSKIELDDDDEDFDIMDDDEDEEDEDGEDILGDDDDDEDEDASDEEADEGESDDAEEDDDAEDEKPAEVKPGEDKKSDDKPADETAEETPEENSDGEPAEEKKSEEKSDEKPAENDEEEE